MRDGAIEVAPHPDREELRILASPIKLDGLRLPNRAGPWLGADSDALLAGIGYDTDEVARLRAGGIV